MVAFVQLSGEDQRTQILDGHSEVNLGTIRMSP
jgi:hypothetical protein